MKIVSNPPQVCFEHALEFWTGLLIYASDGSSARVKQELMRTVPSPEDMSASERRALAIAAAGPSPRGHQPFALRLAS